MAWKLGDEVQVSLPYGATEKTVHGAVIDRIRLEGPFVYYPNRNIRVKFDDPAIYGGTGFAWVDPKVLTHPGEEPADADHALPVT